MSIHRGMYCSLLRFGRHRNLPKVIVGRLSVASGKGPSPDEERASGPFETARDLPVGDPTIVFLLLPLRSTDIVIDYIAAERIPQHG